MTCERIADAAMRQHTMRGLLPSRCSLVVCQGGFTHATRHGRSQAATDQGRRQLGPLGKLERAAVQWLNRIMEEEGRRAQKIINVNGQLVRPIDVVNADGEDDEEVVGDWGRPPTLGFLEKMVVEFLQSIRSSETERVRTNTLRPKDLEEAKRGPLGRLEDYVVRLLQSIRESEQVRAELSRLRRVVVRPIDVPGPLGEFEMAVTDLIRAEKKRSAEREKMGGKIVRPKDASWRGPLGEAEQKAYDAIQALNTEEMERLRNIRRVLEDNRPMETQQNSLLGFLEAFVVGLLRAPQLIISVFRSEVLPDEDKKVLDDAANRLNENKNS